MTKAKSLPEKEKLPPQITFTEAEIKEVSDFVNFVFNNAKFEMNSKQAMDYSKALANMSAHIKKLDDNVFEIKRITQARKA